MAYKVSYKVVSEQGEQLKNIAKDMDNYINQVNQIVSKLGNDELLQSVRSDLNKFKQQLEEEKTVLNLAGQVIVDVIQSYTGVEKKSVSKVDKAKAHNRDFYKRPVAVASAGGGAGVGAVAAGGSVNVASSSSVSYKSVSNTTNVYTSAPSMGASSAAGSYVNTASTGAFSSSVPTDITSGLGTGAEGTVAAAGGIAAAVAGSVAAGAGIMGLMKDKETDTTGSEADNTENIE